MERLHRQPQGWELFPSHLLDLILEKLKSTKDSLHFGAVCPEWHSIFKDNQPFGMPSQCQVPMLLFPDKDDTTIYNVMDNKVFASKLYVPYEKRFRGSSRGWLVDVSRDLSVTLHKPFSMLKEENIGCKHTIKLPRISYTPDNRLPRIEDPVTHVEITSDPQENPEDCIVFLFVIGIGIVFARLADCSWTLIHINIDMNNDFSLHDFVFHKNLLYASSYGGSLLSIDLEDPGGWSQELVAPSVPKALEEEFSRPYYFTKHVFSHCGNIWHVERLNERGCRQARAFTVTKRFRIFQLDFDERAWIQLNSIGNRALFLGTNSPVCVNASEFAGCKPDCIYFTEDDVGFPCEDRGIYDIKSGKFERRLGNNATILLRTSSTLPVWVIPTFNSY